MELCKENEPGSRISSPTEKINALWGIGELEKSDYSATPKYHKTRIINLADYNNNSYKKVNNASYKMAA